MRTKNIMPAFSDPRSSPGRASPPSPTSPPSTPCRHPRTHKQARPSVRLSDDGRSTRLEGAAGRPSPAPRMIPTLLSRREVLRLLGTPQSRRPGGGVPFEARLRQPRSFGKGRAIILGKGQRPALLFAQRMGRGVACTRPREPITLGKGQAIILAANISRRREPGRREIPGAAGRMASAAGRRAPARNAGNEPAGPLPPSRSRARL